MRSKKYCSIFKLANALNKFRSADQIGYRNSSFRVAAMGRMSEWANHSQAHFCSLQLCFFFSFSTSLFSSSFLFGSLRKNKIYNLYTNQSTGWDLGVQLIILIVHIQTQIARVIFFKMQIPKSMSYEQDVLHHLYINNIIIKLLLYIMI